ncbi:unnamed protein product, partial [Ectocarpus sp. 6 AP-2014]
KKCPGLWSPLLRCSEEPVQQVHFARLTALRLLHTETSNAIFKRRVMVTSTGALVGMASWCFASCGAFIVPTPTTLSARPTSTAARMSAGSDYVSTLPGAPFADGKVWDPVGLSSEADPDDIKKWRETEIKHGRVAMLASVGVLVAENFHPLFLGPDYIGPAIFHFEEITARFPQFWALTLLAIAWLEYRQINIGFAELDPVTGEGGMRLDYVPGDLGFDPLGLAPEDEDELNVMKTKELNHGRLAMIGITGMIVQELVRPLPILG